MPFNPDSHLHAEVASQPSDWEAVTARLPEFASALPSRGARVAVLGSGTSYYMAQAYAARRELSENGETDAFAASETPSASPISGQPYPPAVPSSISKMPAGAAGEARLAATAAARSAT